MLGFYAKNSYVLLFGIAQIFFTAPGQTFLLSLFIVPIFRDLDLTQSSFATIYSAATLSAALFLNLAGRWLDRVSTSKAIIAQCMAMSLACLYLSLSSGVCSVFISILLLRFLGQGVFSLCASTLLIKKFSANRGKALGCIGLGFPLSEAIYPSIAIALLSSVGWRGSYALFSLSYLVLMLPLQLALLKLSDTRDELDSGEIDRHCGEEQNSCALATVLRDYRFYLLLFASCFPPVVVTALFFHQHSLFTANHWPIELAATGLMSYALSKALGALLIGPVIDRIGPFAPFVALVLLLATGTLITTLGGGPFYCHCYYALIGTSLGFSAPVMNTIWPLLYGTEHIGSIKGFVGIFRNGLTSLGPLPVAILLERGIAMDEIVSLLSYAVFASAALPLVVWKAPHSRTR